MCLSSSAEFLVSGGLDHRVNIWDLKTKRLHRSLKVRAEQGQECRYHHVNVISETVTETDVPPSPRTIKKR